MWYNIATFRGRENEKEISKNNTMVNTNGNRCNYID